MTANAIDRFREPLLEIVSKEFPVRALREPLPTACDGRIRKVAERAFACISQDIFSEERTGWPVSAKFSSRTRFEIFHGCWAVYCGEGCLGAVSEVVKEHARQNAGWVARNIRRVGIQDQQVLFEIAKVCIGSKRKSERGVVTCIPDFGIRSQEALSVLAERCARTNAAGTVSVIQRFGIQDQGTLVKIAKLCAQRDRLATAAGIQNFGIQSQEALAEIRLLCTDGSVVETAKDIGHLLDPLTILSLSAEEWASRMPSEVSQSAASKRGVKRAGCVENPLDPLTILSLPAEEWASSRPSAVSLPANGEMSEIPHPDFEEPQDSTHVRSFGEPESGTIDSFWFEGGAFDRSSL